jgi:two-component system cell cycle sensor histidine kinase/response regulator CckA
VTARRERSMSVRAAFLWMGVSAAVYVAALGGYVLLELGPAAGALGRRAGTLAVEYDSLRDRTRTLEAAFGRVEQLSRVSALTPTDRQAARALATTLAAVAQQSAGVQASLVLTGISATMRMALAEAADLESRVAGALIEALNDLGQGDARSAAAWTLRAEGMRPALIARLTGAERLGLVDMAARERVLGGRAGRVGLAVLVWLALGAGLVALAGAVLQRRLYVPLALLDRGLARVAEGDLDATLPVSRADELGRLSAHFNEMTAVLSARPEVEALRRSEVRFRSLIENGMDLISIIGADGRFTYASPAVTRLLGYGQTELIGAVGFGYVHPNDRARVEAAFARAIGGATSEIREEFRFRHKNGSWRCFESVVTNLVDEPMVAGLVINSRDVTERRQAEETLHRERFLVDMLMEHIPDSIYFKDAEGRFLRVNRALAQRTGLRDPSEAIGKTDFDLFAPKHAEAARKVEREILRTGRPVLDLEEQETWPDRPSAWVSTTKMPLRDAAGAPIGTFGISRDITERKEAEIALHKSEENLARVFKLAPVAISISDLSDGRLLDVNEAYVKMLGYGREELIGRSSVDVGLWADARDRTELARVVAELGMVRDYALRLRTRDGRIREVQGSFQRIELESGAGLLAAFQDTTERREAERLLRESETRFRTAFMTMADAHLIATRDEGQLIEVNERFLTMFGFRREEVIGRTAHELKLYADQRDRARMLDALRTAGQVRSFETLARLKSGETIPVLLSVSEIPGTDPRLLLSVVRDVSEQRRSAAALQSLEEQFRQAQRLEAVGRLAGGVAHDFNNILTAITGYAQLLLADFRENDPRRADLEEILAASQRATALTRQLLAFSRKQVLQPRVLDLNDVVQGLEKMLRRLIGEDVELAFAPAAGLRAVRADPGQIEQVLLNLAVNARDAMPGGGQLTIETANIELDAAYARDHAGVGPGAYVMLAVSDTGTGMDAETRSHIFEPFFTTKEPGKGTGLGLATVHGIVKQSGGHISVYSEPGRGTAFKIYLPRVESAPESPSAEVGAPQPGRAHETVLVVEDDRAVRDVVAATLIQHGYRVLQAPDGRTALKLAQKAAGQVHILLTDVVMPGMQGRELAQALAAEHSGLRVLYMSGYTDDAVIRNGVLEAGTPFLQKPFTTEALVLKVREVLDRRG